MVIIKINKKQKKYNGMLHKVPAVYEPPSGGEA